jgi:hypothetical protein
MPPLHNLRTLKPSALHSVRLLSSSQAKRAPAMAAANGTG